MTSHFCAIHGVLAIPIRFLISSSDKCPTAFVILPIVPSRKVRGTSYHIPRLNASWYEEIKNENAEESPEEECEEIQSPSPQTNDTTKSTDDLPKAQVGSKKTSGSKKPNPAARKSVFLSMDQYQKLAQLGGEIEERVANAVQLYLEFQRPEYRGALSMEMIQYATDADVTENYYNEMPGDQDEDEEDEWFDPADYHEELAAESFAGALSS